jgi:hypothetical protein
MYRLTLLADVLVMTREWWTLFFQLAVIISAVVATALPDRLPRARYPLANMLSIASVLIMVSIKQGMPVTALVLATSVAACWRCSGLHPQPASTALVPASAGCPEQRHHGHVGVLG